MVSFHVDFFSLSKTTECQSQPSTAGLEPLYSQLPRLPQISDSLNPLQEHQASLDGATRARFRTTSLEDLLLSLPHLSAVYSLFIRTYSRQFAENSGKILEMAQVAGEYETRSFELWEMTSGIQQGFPRPNAAH